MNASARKERLCEVDFLLEGLTRGSADDAAGIEVLSQFQLGEIEIRSAFSDSRFADSLFSRIWEVPSHVRQCHSICTQKPLSRIQLGKIKTHVAFSVSHFTDL